MTGSKTRVKRVKTRVIDGCKGWQIANGVGKLTVNMVNLTSFIVKTGQFSTQCVNIHVPCSKQGVLHSCAVLNALWK